MNHPYMTRDDMERRIAALEESLHYCNGTADLAIKHRDIAEAENTELAAQVAALAEALTHITEIRQGLRASEGFGVASKMNKRADGMADIAQKALASPSARAKAMVEVFESAHAFSKERATSQGWMSSELADKIDAAFDTYEALQATEE